ncbi:MAG: metallophosphoesterase [Lentisphaeria bacterium]|nr:metallophosphoesterase [Lentisphaeria bacterium]
MKIRAWFGILSALLCLTVVSAGAKPGEGASDSYKVLVMGDAHFDSGEFHKAPPSTDGRKGERNRNLKMWRSKSPALFSAAGKRASAEQAAFAVQLGDMVQGDCDDAKLQGEMIRSGFAAIKKNFPDIPLLIVKGNHDIRVVGRGKNNAAANAVLLPIISAELGRKVTKNSCYAFLRGRDLFIAVDGFIPAKEMTAFVKKTLDRHPDTRYVFFMTHLPLMPASTGAPLWLVPGWDDIAGMLEKRNTLILAAHTHAPSLATRKTARGKLTQLIVSSMGNTWSSKRSKGRFGDWASYVKSADMNIPKAKNPEKSRKRWNAWKNSGDFTFRHLFGNSGFAVLEIDDEKVVARYYTNSSAKPAVTLRLLTNH